MPTGPLEQGSWDTSLKGKFMSLNPVNLRSKEVEEGSAPQSKGKRKDKQRDKQKKILPQK